MALPKTRVFEDLDWTQVGPASRGEEEEFKCEQY